MQAFDLLSQAEEILNSSDDSSVYRNFLLSIDSKVLQDIPYLPLHAKDFPGQTYPLHSFAASTITLTAGKFGYLDLYGWNPSGTTIHSHAFAGAFRVLKGETGESEYLHYHDKEVLNGVWEGRLVPVKQQVLHTGDTALIERGSIHQTIYSREGTISLCMRTVSSREEKTSVYLPNGMKILRPSLSNDDIRKLLHMSYLYKTSALPDETMTGLIADEILCWLSVSPLPGLEPALLERIRKASPRKELMQKIDEGLLLLKKLKLKWESFQ